MHTSDLREAEFVIVECVERSHWQDKREYVYSRSQLEKASCVALVDVWYWFMVVQTGGGGCQSSGVW